MRILRTVSFRVVAGSLLLLLVAFAVFTAFTVSFYTNRMMAQAVDSAHGVSDLILSSTRYSMLLNRRQDVDQIIRTIGREPGVEGIRVYNKRGVITLSTVPGEVGRMVDLHAEACYGCHEENRPLVALPTRNRTRIYQGRAAHRVLGVINPIRNSAGCQTGGCHTGPEERTVLGVLDVRMSLQHVDAAIAQSRSRTIRWAAVGLVAVGLASGVFLALTVHRPIRALREGTRQLAAGNLGYEIPVRSDDDLGQLATSFNAMTRSLRDSQEENRRWAETLEERVREKTAELQRIDQQILQIEKMASLGTLAATVAHEINNPLSGILTYAKLEAKRVRRMGAETEFLQQLLRDLDLIIAETQRCGGIVQNLLLFSRRTGGEQKPLRLEDVLERAVQLVSHHFAISNVRFERAPDSQDLEVQGDEAQLQQALVALFVNAVEAMPEGGTLRVAIGRDEKTGGTRLAVSDTGVGIAPEDLPHLFEPFFTTKTAGKGVGLGLSVVYGIMERHGGSVSVASSPGQGTTFTLNFPPPGAAAAAASPEETAREPERAPIASRAPGLSGA